MWILPVAALAVAAWLALRQPDALPVAVPVMVLWTLSPGRGVVAEPGVPPAPPACLPTGPSFGQSPGRPGGSSKRSSGRRTTICRPTTSRRIRREGSRTARRRPTSGLSLLANLAAYDFGYLALAAMIVRTEATLATLERMQRYRGHFYNWYDTQTLEPLRPLYVSTVDSGNLAGHLITLAAGLDELATASSSARHRFSRALSDTLDVRRGRAGSAPRGPACSALAAAGAVAAAVRMPCSSPPIRVARAPAEPCWHRERTSPASGRIAGASR